MCIRDRFSAGHWDCSVRAFSLTKNKTVAVAIRHFGKQALLCIIISVLHTETLYSYNLLKQSYNCSHRYLYNVLFLYYFLLWNILCCKLSILLFFFYIVLIIISRLWKNNNFYYPNIIFFVVNNNKEYSANTNLLLKCCPTFTVNVHVALKSSRLSHICLLYTSRCV